MRSRCWIGVWSSLSSKGLVDGGIRIHGLMVREWGKYHGRIRRGMDRKIVCHGKRITGVTLLLHAISGWEPTGTIGNDQ